MNFCKVCDNMYYMKIKEDDTEALIYYCKNCGMEEDNLVLTNLCVSRTEEGNSTQKTNKINEYTIHDPTRFREPHRHFALRLRAATNRINRK